MATVSIAEFRHAHRVQDGWIPIVKAPPVKVTSVVVGSSPTSTSGFDAETTIIRVRTDAACNIAIGTDPDAGDPDQAFPIDANLPEYFAVEPGWVVSVGP